MPLSTITPPLSTLEIVPTMNNKWMDVPNMEKVARVLEN
jgi:hypothetical protein